MSFLYLSPHIARYPASARLAIFVVTLLGLWLPIVVPIYWIWGTNNTISIITVLALYSESVGLLWIWGRTVHQKTHPFQHHGLSRTRQNRQELIQGLMIGGTSSGKHSTQ